HSTLPNKLSFPFIRNHCCYCGGSTDINQYVPRILQRSSQMVEQPRESIDRPVSGTFGFAILEAIRSTGFGLLFLTLVSSCVSLYSSRPSEHYVCLLIFPLIKNGTSLTSADIDQPHSGCLYWH